MIAFKKIHLLLITSLILTVNAALGEIKNGYESEIEGIRTSLNGLITLLNQDSDLSMFQRAAIKNKVDKLVEYITYFELTEELLEQFRSIAPGLYNEVDTIKDCTGRKVNVFVRFVSENEMQRGAAGTTNLDHLPNDKNIYQSEYGPYTVSIKIASMKRSLFLLAHEFGHVKYQAPNLATYIEFYSLHYQNGIFNSSYIGHNSNDPSGQKALEYENIFRQQYQIIVKDQSFKPENPLARLQEIRKNIKSTPETL